MKAYLITAMLAVAVSVASAQQSLCERDCARCQPQDVQQWGKPLPAQAVGGNGCVQIKEDERIARQIVELLPNDREHGRAILDAAQRMIERLKR